MKALVKKNQILKHEIQKNNLNFATENSETDTSINSPPAFLFSHRQHRL